MNGLTFALAAGVIAAALVGCSGDDEKTDATATAAATTAASSATAAASATTAAPVAIKLDPAFGSGGVLAAPMSTTANDRFMAVAVGSDGKTYAAGFVANAGDQALAVARLDATGKLDATFGTGGVASVNVAAGGKTAEIARSVVIQADGKVIIAGPVEHDPTAAGDAARDTDVALVRFDTAGKLDATFGTQGVSRIDLGVGKATSATAFVGDSSWGMGLLPGGKIVVFGSKLAEGADRTDADYVLMGLDATGKLDAAFGKAGTLVVDQNKSGDSPRNLLVQSDGKIVATGYSSGADSVVSPVIVRTSATGVLDTTWGTGGIATAKVLPGVAESYQVAQQGNNYILAGYGRGADTAEKVDLIVYRFTAAGQWDQTFGTAGVARVDIAKEDDRARNVMVLPDGRILAAGSGKKDATNVDATLALFDKEGKPDATFGTNGQIISDLGGVNDSWYGLALTADKSKVIVTGFKGVDAASGGNDDSVVAQILLK